MIHNRKQGVATSYFHLKIKLSSGFLQVSIQWCLMQIKSILIPFESIYFISVLFDRPSFRDSFLSSSFGTTQEHIVLYTKYFCAHNCLLKKLHILCAGKDFSFPEGFRVFLDRSSHGQLVRWHHLTGLTRKKNGTLGSRSSSSHVKSWPWRYHSPITQGGCLPLKGKDCHARSR